MRLYELVDPILDVPVRYKVLGVDEIEHLTTQYGNSTQDSFTKAVLESVIHNLKTEVTGALRRCTKEQADRALTALYNGALMLNPGLDPEGWLQLSNTSLLEPMPHVGRKSGMSAPHHAPATARTRSRSKITKQKYMNLERHLKDRVIGQDAAVEDLVHALGRNQAGLSDEKRPVGVFLLAGSSGVGKTLIARELHEYLFPGTQMLRIDMGEYQHKHENAKLTGSPPGYVGHEEGSVLAEQLAKNPQTVFLIDEIEKAHPDVLNTFLSVFDEGVMKDARGGTLNFRETIILLTTNLGNADIVREQRNGNVGFGRKTDGAPPREAVLRATLRAIQGHFPPEVINRFDKIITFNHLGHDDYMKIAELELGVVQTKLEKRGLSLAFEQPAVEAMVREGTDHVQGARRLAQLRRDRIEDPLAELILNGRFPRGTIFQLLYDADGFKMLVDRPAVKQRLPARASSPMPRPVKGAA